MRDQLVAIIDELKTLKAEGTSQVFVQASHLARLKSAAEALASATAVTLPAVAADPGSGSPLSSAPESSAGSVSKENSISETVRKDGQKGGVPATSNLPEPPEVQLPDGEKAERWEWLQQRVLKCTICNAHVRKERGKKVVFGVGNLDADIFFCGEAPGAEEEVQGEPFVGPAGQLLTKIIRAMGLEREQVYIGNIMNWRPEMPTEFGNRKPYLDEIAFCLPYLLAQIEIVQPKVIVALGATAVDGLLGHDPKRRLGRIRGQWQQLGERPLMVTFHPSYLLHNNTLRTKRMVWEDMLSVMEKLKMPISEKQRGFFL